MRLGPLGAALALALLVSGCGAGSDKKVPNRELQKLVLRQRDLPGYAQFAFGAESRSELAAADAAKGRQNGWAARYRKVETAGAGPLTAASTVEVFGSGGQAHAYFRALEQQQESLNSASGLAAANVSGLGDERFAGVSRATTPHTIRSVSLAWRRGRYVAAMSASGYASDFRLGDAVRLARRVDSRMRR